MCRILLSDSPFYFSLRSAFEKMELFQGNLLVDEKRQTSAFLSSDVSRLRLTPFLASRAVCAYYGLLGAF